MWLMNFVPDIIFHTILIAGILIFFTSFLLRFLPFFRAYGAIIQLVSVVLITFGVWFEGAMSVQAEWEAKIVAMELKVAEAEAKSEKTNTVIVTQVVEKTKVIHTKGKDILNYVDREVVKDKEVIKFVENCPIPDAIIKSHNAGALNQPIEIIKAPEPAASAVPEQKVETPIEPTKTMATVTTWANIRPTKDISSEKIEKLAPYTKIEVIRLEGNYAFVKNIKEGWIGKEFISIEKKG
jgi:hypothetical protein